MYTAEGLQDDSTGRVGNDPSESEATDLARLLTVFLLLTHGEWRGDVITMN